MLPVVVEECKRQLCEQKFVELKEKEPWNIQQGGKVCVASLAASIKKVYTLSIVFCC